MGGDEEGLSWKRMSRYHETEGEGNQQNIKLTKNVTND